MNVELNKNNNPYQVLARKYRPQKFSELIGQETLVNIITNALKKDIIAHAYLLTGIRGVGKTTTARLIARALNCNEIKENEYEPCGKCQSCQSILEENNMDVIEMDAASRTGVDDVREIIENVKYKPSNSKYKIYIIDEVHMLSKNAFNALLKTLEEPPSHVKFLFATTEVQKLPITILSRCQRFDLFRVNNEKLTSHILEIAKKENISISPDAAALIIRSADGSVRDAISLLDQSRSNSDESIDTNHIVKMLGLTDRGKIYDLIDLIFKGNASEALLLYKSIYSQGADPLMIFEEMIRIVHFLSEAKILPSILKDPYIPELEKIRGEKMSSQLTMSTLGIFWQSIFKGYQELQHTPHTYQTSEMILIRLIHLSNVPPPSELIKKVEDSNEYIKNNDIQSLEKEEIKDKTIQKIGDSQDTKNKTSKKDFQKKINSYRDFVELFRKYKEPLMYTKLYNNVKLVSFEEGKVILNIQELRDNNFGREIKKLISKWTGRIWNVDLSDNKTGKTLAEEDVIIKQKLLEEINNYPEVKKILESFPGSKIHSIESINEVKEKNENKVKGLQQQEKK